MLQKPNMLLPGFGFAGSPQFTVKIAHFQQTFRPLQLCQNTPHSLMDILFHEFFHVLRLLAKLGRFGFPLGKNKTMRFSDHQRPISLSHGCGESPAVIRQGHLHVLQDLVVHDSPAPPEGIAGMWFRPGFHEFYCADEFPQIDQYFDMRGEEERIVVRSLRFRCLL